MALAGLLTRASIIVIVALSAAVPAEASVEDVHSQHVFSFGTFVADLQPPHTPYAVKLQSWSVRLVLGPNAAFQGDASTRVQLSATQGNQTVATVARLEGSLWSFNWTIPAHGDWNITIHVEGDSVRATGTTPVHVYPWLGYRILTELVSPQTGSPTQISFRVEPADSAQAAALPVQLLVRLQRWNEWETTLISTANATATRTTNGTWNLSYEFADPGTYRVAVAAPDGGLAFGGMPEQRFEVTNGPSAKQTPFTPLLLGASGLLILALAALLTKWRRQPRG